MPPTPPEANDSPDDTSPGVPGFRSWKAVYLFVLFCFGLGVAFLTWFSRTYS